MTSLEIISYRDPKLLNNHLQVLRCSSHAVPTAADLLAAFFDRAAKFQTSQIVFVDMAINVVIVLNMSLDRFIPVENRSIIVDRLINLFVKGETSDWLFGNNNEGPNVTQVYRYIIRACTFESKTTRELFNGLLSSALNSLEMAVRPDYGPSANILMELGEYYLMNGNCKKAADYFLKSLDLINQVVKPDVPSNNSVVEKPAYQNQPEGLYQDPDKRISTSRLRVLLRATGMQETTSVSRRDPRTLASNLLDSSIACSPSADDVVFRSLWNLLHYSAPMNLAAIVHDGGNAELVLERIQNVADAISKIAVADNACPPFPVERLRMWIEQTRIKSAFLSTESDSPSPPTFKLETNSVQLRSNLIELIQVAFLRGLESSIPVSGTSEHRYDDIISCAFEVQRKNPESLARLLLISEQASIAERFVLASPTSAFTVAAVLSSLANNLQPSPLNIDTTFFRITFNDANAKRLLSKFTIPVKDFRSRLLQCLLRVLVSSTAMSTDPIAHFKAIAKVCYSKSDFRDCVRALLIVSRIAFKGTLLNGPVFSDPVYYEMLITALSKIGEFFDAAVLCQIDNYLDLDKGARLLMTSPRRLQHQMFDYILYPELVEALVLAFDKISPDPIKKQIALNLMSRPIMLIKRQHPQRAFLLEKFVALLLLKPQYTFHDHAKLIH